LDADLQISLTHSGSYPIMDLVGEVDAYTSSNFREEMIKALSGDIQHLIISMNGVEYIDSSGLGALVGGLKRVSEKQGSICIVCTNPQVIKVFEITGLVKVFPIFTSVGEACEAIDSGKVSIASES
jgi:anti-sigma B factor antagonist